MSVPAFWKSTLKDIDEVVGRIKKGKVSTYKSAGNRDIYFIEYGEKNQYNRTANYSSACGAKNIKCYADKTAEGVKPCLFLVGCIHGGEFEGTVAILNLISIIETGVDLAGETRPEYDFIKGIEDKINLIIVPCSNPDGRARIPFDSVVGMSLEDFRYYDQGAWKDGSVMSFPRYKSIHPIKEEAGFMGGYFNDDGINQMHDDFFDPKAKETKMLLDKVDEYVPDATVLFHGATGSTTHILQPENTPLFFRKEVIRIASAVRKHFAEYGLDLYFDDVDDREYVFPFAFNLVTAMTYKCGELCFTYESHQGTANAKKLLTHEQIYLQHILAMDEFVAYVEEKIQRIKEDRLP